MVMHAQIAIYIGGLVLGESSLAAAGFGYAADMVNGKVQNERFNTINTLHIKDFYTGTTTNQLMVNWNVQIHYWLKYYVMLRCMDRSLPRGSSQAMPIAATIIASSVWHGTYPGFYILFIGAILCDITCKQLERTKLARKVREHLPPALLNLVMWCWTFTIHPHFGMGVLYLRLDHFLTYNSHIGPVPMVLFGLLLISAVLLPKDRKDSKVKAN